MKKVIDYLTPRPALFFLLAALLWSGVMFFLNNQQAIQWKDIFVEADGMVFDLLVFGALLAWYDGKRQKNERVEQDKNLIDDFRGWENEEAMYRIVGAVKRLNRKGVTVINLGGCFLAGAKLDEANLKGANLQGANLREAKLFNSNLIEAKLGYARLDKASLNRANLTASNLRGISLQGAKVLAADLQGANLQGANLQEANLQGANLQEANLQKANLEKTNLEKATVGDDWFEKLETWGTKGREEIKEKYKIDMNGDLELKESPSGIVKVPILSYRQFKKT